jgi:hypothetical protein
MFALDVSRHGAGPLAKVQSSYVAVEMAAYDKRGQVQVMAGFNQTTITQEAAPGRVDLNESTAPRASSAASHRR